MDLIFNQEKVLKRGSGPFLKRHSLPLVLKQQLGCHVVGGPMGREGTTDGL